MNVGCYKREWIWAIKQNLGLTWQMLHFLSSSGVALWDGLTLQRQVLICFSLSPVPTYPILSPSSRSCCIFTQHLENIDRHLILLRKKHYLIYDKKLKKHKELNTPCNKGTLPRKTCHRRWVSSHGSDRESLTSFPLQNHSVSSSSTNKTTKWKQCTQTQRPLRPEVKHSQEHTLTSSSPLG